MSLALPAVGNGFSPIAQAVKAFKSGKMLIVVDAKERENKGDIVIAGKMVKPKHIRFMLDHGSGMICVPMKGKDLDRLKLPLMVPHGSNTESHRTAFTWTVDAEGTSTGISEYDRALTINALASPTSLERDFRKPGHVNPLRYQEGGVLERAGPTEAAVDLAEMAGFFPPVAAICEVRNKQMKSTGMARLPELMALANEHSLHIISIEDLIAYRRTVVWQAGSAPVNNKTGLFHKYCYKKSIHDDKIEHLACVKGDIGSGNNVLVRVQWECLKGDVFFATDCDCKCQKDNAMQKIENEGRGILLYLRGHKEKACRLNSYNPQNPCLDTLEPCDILKVAQILQDLGVKSVTLMNNPGEYEELNSYGVLINGHTKC